VHKQAEVTCRDLLSLSKLVRELTQDVQEAKMQSECFRSESLKLANQLKSST